MITLGLLAHGGKELTGRYMYHFATDFASDLGGLRALPFPSFYSRVQDIPYRSDDELFPEDQGRIVEVVARPGLLMNRRIFPRLDCKKKSILIGCWARCRGLRYRFVAVDDTGRGVSHVFAEVEESPGAWVSMDCTLPGLFRPGSPMPNVRFAEVF